MLRTSPMVAHAARQGYLCCKRRVLEFDEFLKIEGCKKGRHVFVPKQKAEPVSACSLTPELLDLIRSTAAARRAVHGMSY